MSALPNEAVEPAAADPLLLEYDYYKHLSTIDLVSIAAMLTWVQGNALPGSKGWMIGIALVAISAALSFGAMNTIIDHRKTGKRLRSFFRWERGIATAVFAFGLGMFMSEVGKGLK